MSQENETTVRDGVAAFNRGDLDAWLEYFTDDIDYRAVEGAPDDHGPIEGKDALLLVTNRRPNAHEDLIPASALHPPERLARGRSCDQAAAHSS
jgi:hypothetical protein